MDKGSYVLIHVINYQEFYAPLVLSQVFDQAKTQKISNYKDSPSIVEVWVQVPLRAWFDLRFLDYKKKIKTRFPELSISYVTGIDRLGGFPYKQFISRKRRRFGETPCIFHFRGDDLLSTWIFLKYNHIHDKFVVDIRGLWPAEKLLNDGIEVFDVAELENYEISRSLNQRLINNIYNSDALTTVSIPLLDTLKSMAAYKKPAWVVPCCVNVPTLHENPDSENAKPTIGYLGGTAVYQNLADLVLPLFAEILKIQRVNILILTHQPNEMKTLINESSLLLDSVKIKTLSQDQVGEELKKIDLGFLVRKRNLVNKVAQPVKIGEYLSAGVPVCVEKGLGGVEHVTTGILQLNIEEEGIAKSAQRIVKYLNQTSREQRTQDAHKAAKQFFSWEENIQIHQKNYRNLLNAH